MAHKLVIHRLFFTNSKCYQKSPIQEQVGVQVHCTASGDPKHNPGNPYLKRYVQPNDGLLGKNRYNNSHNRPNVTVCANAYIGKLDDGSVAVYQTLPWNQRCWLSGSASKGNANKAGYIGFETCCKINDEAYFREAVMDKAVKLTAYLCKHMGVSPTEKTICGTVVMDHSELHRAGYASNHSDITNWLRKYGLNMNDFRAAVAKVIEEGIEVEYVDAVPVENSPVMLKKGDSGEEVKKLQKLLGIEADGIFGMATKRAVQQYQESHGLTADGIVGPKTWAELLKDEPDEQPAETADYEELRHKIGHAAEKLEELKRSIEELKKYVDEMMNE